MAADGSNSLFPLPLNLLEVAFLSVDTPRYPMQFQLSFLVNRELNLDTWREACRAAVRRHPLFSAIIGTDRTGQSEWMAPTSYDPDVMLVDSRNEVDHSPLEPYSVPGLRISVVAGDRDFLVWLHVHHAVSDGLGAVQVLTDMREIYFALLENRPPQLSTLDEVRLRERARFGLSRWGWCCRLPQDTLGMLGLYEYFLHWPVALGTTRTGKQSALDHDSHRQPDLNTTFSAVETRKLRDLGRAEQVTLNDILLTAAFQALYDTLTANQRKPAHDVIRIMIPTSLRQPSDAATPAANIVSTVFLDRRPGRFRSPRALLRSVHREMWLCKSWKAGITLFRILSWKLWFGRGTLPPPQFDRCLTTAVLSNLGEIPAASCGNLLSEPACDSSDEHLEFAPPVAPMTAVSWGVVTWNERLSITLNYDRQRLSPAEAAAIQERLEFRLREWMSPPQ